jgi:hypothetical protein
MACHCPDEDHSVELDPRKIKLDGSTQPRELPNHELIQDYAEDYKRGDKFPPVTVFYDGTNYWLADGYHRVKAAILARMKTVACEVRMGDKREATLFSVGANAKHGLRRTNGDKRRSVLRMLNDDVWGLWTNRRIADACGVSDTMIEPLRKESINPRARSSVREALKDGRPVMMETKPSRPSVATEPLEAEDVITLAASTPPPVQKSGLSIRLSFLNSLRDRNVDVEPNFMVDRLGASLIKTSTAIHAVVSPMSPHAFRDVFATVVMARQVIDPGHKLRAVIVGQRVDAVEDWIAVARECGVDFIDQH